MKEVDQYVNGNQAENFDGTNLRPADIEQVSNLVQQFENSKFYN